jgi:hypothetical protein
MALGKHERPVVVLENKMGEAARNVTDHFMDFIGFYMLTPGPSPSENSS